MVLHLFFIILQRTVANIYLSATKSNETGMLVVIKDTTRRIWLLDLVHGVGEVVEQERGDDHLDSDFSKFSK